MTGKGAWSLDSHKWTGRQTRVTASPTVVTGPGQVPKPLRGTILPFYAQESCPLMSTTQGSTILCTPTSWSRTGPDPPPPPRKGEGVWRCPIPLPHLCPLTLFPSPTAPAPAPSPPPLPLPSRHLPCLTPALRLSSSLALLLPWPGTWGILSQPVAGGG